MARTQPGANWKPSLFLSNRKPHFRRALNALCLALLLPAGPALAGNWPGWRGPNGTGVSTEKNLPTTWSTNENVRWRTELPGPGNSSPIVWENRVFVTQAVKKDDRRTLMCLDRRDGKVLWQSGVTYTNKEATHDSNPYCAGSPVTDGKIVVACFGSAGVYAYDFAGKELWHRDLGKLDHMFGNSISPIFYEDLCILNFGPDANARLIALRKRTGETVWEVKPPQPEEVERQFALAGPGMFVAPEIVKQADKNADEQLTKDEFAGLAASWFEKMDSQGTGKLNQQSFLEKLEVVLPPPEGGRRGSAKTVGPILFSAADADKDTAVTREELQSAFGKWFTEWDKEPSGILNEDEIRVGLHSRLPSAEPGRTSASGTRDVSGSWSTPLVVSAKGQDELVVNFAHRLVAYDPKTGKQLWISKGLGGSIYTSPLWGEGVVVATSSGVGNGNAIAVKPGQRGEITDEQRMWRLDRAKGAIGSGVIHDQHLYLISADGIAECLDLKTGKRVWDERLKGPTSRNSSWSSMLLAEDTIYVPNQSGDVFVLRASPKFEQLACNSVYEPSNASLAASNGDLFFRTDNALWCFTPKK